MITNGYLISPMKMRSLWDLSNEVLNHILSHGASKLPQVIDLELLKIGLFGSFTWTSGNYDAPLGKNHAVSQSKDIISDLEHFTSLSLFSNSDKSF